MNRKTIRTLACATIVITGLIGPVVAQEPVIWLAKQCEQTPCQLQDPECGHTWAKAFCTLQEALDAVTPNEDIPQQIWVAAGTYRPGNDPADSFEIPSGVWVFGGFAGNEDPAEFDPLVNARDFQANETTLTGDIGTPGVASDNCHAVVVIAGTIRTPMLDGFTIRDGYGGASYGCGAGIHIYGGASPTLANLRIMNCYAPDAGGGVYVDDGSPNFTNCRFENNRAGYGAALYLAVGSAQMNLERCVFVSNTAEQQAAAILNSRSGLVRTVNTIFIGNRCLGNEPGGTVFHAPFSGVNAQYVNCLFHANSSFADGAAMWNGSQSSVTLINCTATYNTSTCGNGGGLHVQGGTTNVVNSVLWGNADADGIDESAQIHVSGGFCTVTYTCIQGKTIFNDQTNTGSDPQFRDQDGVDNVPGTLDDDFRLAGSPFSPCIDKGDSLQISELYDLDSLTRKVNGDGLGSNEVDMGAYEYQGALVDCNRNGISDTLDIQNSTSQDCQPNGVPDECDIASGASRDCNGNGVPDGCEFTADCNHNCVEDATDIQPGGGSQDANDNDIPDECEFSRSGRWSADADFDAGTLINVNHGTTGQLTRNSVEATAPLPYLWVAASDRGTVIRINTDTGDILGEYRSAPRQHTTLCEGAEFAPSPSRTTVDLDGSVWVANRYDNYPFNEPETGSVTKFGAVVGGGRVNALGEPDAGGEYLAPPFTYCTCEDRDGDGLIRTSRGLGDALSWDNADGADDDGGVTSAADECVLRHVRVDSLGARAIAVDKENNVWVGGNDNRAFNVLDNATGDILESFNANYGGYGALIDCQGVLWSTQRDPARLLRYETKGTVTTADDDSTVVISSLVADPYGLGIDNQGHIWNSQHNASGPHSYIVELDHAGVTALHSVQISNNYENRGVAVTPRDNNVWVAHTATDDVTRLDPNGVVVYTIAVGDRPTGLAVDRNGIVWVTNYEGDSVTRIEPNENDPNDYDTTVISLGADAGPYNYSDMTGMVGLQTTGTGTWSVVDDGGHEGTVWRHILWNQEPGCDPNDARLAVDERAADRVTDLPALAYQHVQTNGGVLSSVVGRFIQVRVRFHGSCPGTTYDSPVLCDLAVVPTDTCAMGDVDLNAVVDGRDIQVFVDVMLGSNTDPAAYQAADMDFSGVVDLSDVPCFVELLVTGVSSCGDPCGGGPAWRGGDCNGNAIPDANDIYNATSQDCNGNFIPDECDIAAETSNDLNENGVPDECEPDCNQNGVPDDWDIAQQTSADIDSNGVPDECQPDCNSNGIPDYWDVDPNDPDGNNLVSADCDGNGGPDECQRDCNQNGVPDVCDIDPNDPDGDQVVWPDCNGNHRPDACDFNWPPPFGSLDCNENGVPDECDIANCPENDPSCQDCNENGFPDSCDIAAEISLDENENGIPDECEGEGMMGGGMMRQESMFFGDPEARRAAWAEYYDWLAQQEWGANSELSGVEQFRAMTDKLGELGLPVRNPRAQ